jgi:hypothetical protein
MTLFGGDISLAAQLVIAVAIAVGLIGAAAWMVRRFLPQRLDATSRARWPRVALIEATNIDGRRHLILIRRDNIEHLMLIGGRNTVLIERNIVRASAPREAQATHRPAARDALPPTVPFVEGPTRRSPTEPARSSLRCAPPSRCSHRSHQRGRSRRTGPHRRTNARQGEAIHPTDLRRY